MTSSRRRINSLIHDRSRSTSPSATRCIATFSKAAPPVVAELGESERKRGGTRLGQCSERHPDTLDREVNAGGPEGSRGAIVFRWAIQSKEDKVVVESEAKLE